MEQLPPCPVCGSPPVLEQCEPWPKEAGPPAWHIWCYRNRPWEHYIGTNGDDKVDAKAQWRRLVASPKLKD